MAVGTGQDRNSNKLSPHATQMIVAVFINLKLADSHFHNCSNLSFLNRAFSEDLISKTRNPWVTGCTVV